MLQQTHPIHIPHLGETDENQHLHKQIDNYHRVANLRTSLCGNGLSPEPAFSKTDLILAEPPTTPADSARSRAGAAAEENAAMSPSQLIRRIHQSTRLYY